MGPNHDEETPRMRSHRPSNSISASDRFEEEPLSNGEKTLASDFTALTTHLRSRDIRQMSIRAKFLMTVAGVGLCLFLLSYFPRDIREPAAQAAVQAVVDTHSPAADEAVVPVSPPPPPPTSQGPKRKALVIASFKEQSMGWLDDVPDDWEIYRYVADDPFANYTVPRNQGQEAMAYTTFLIDHYDNLPDYMVFVHGHQKAWHQPPPMPWLLKSMDLGVVDRSGWVSLRCSNWGRCEGPHMYTHPREGNWAMAVILRGIHDFVYLKTDPWYEDLPQDIAVACCAQFAVTKEQTLKKPRDFWVRLREPLLRDLEKSFPEWNPTDAEGTMTWRMGATFEFSWHWFFSMPPVYCPTESFCTNELFQDKVHCDQKTLGPPESFGTWDKINCTFEAEKSGPVAEVSLPVSPAPPQSDPKLFTPP